MNTPYYVKAAVNRKAGELPYYDPEKKEWFVCRRTSERVAGQPNPVVKKVLIARCTPMGREELSSEPEFTVADCSCYEFGISKVLMANLPAHWMKSCGAYGEALFLTAVHRVLPQSYLLIGKEYSLPERGINAELRIKNLWEEYEAAGITLEALMPLRSLYLIRFPDHSVVTSPSAEQADLLAKFKTPLA